MVNRDKLLVVGHLAKDIVTTKSGSSEFWGGAGYHVSLAASMYLPKNKIILKSVAGFDFDKAILLKHGVDVKYISIDIDHDSDRHYLDESGEERKYFPKGNLNESIKVDDLDEIIDEIVWIHLASSPPKQQLIWIDQLKKYNHHFILSCDTFDTFAKDCPKDVIKVINECDMGFLNSTEWDDIGAGTLEGKLIRKLGGKGAEIYENKKMIYKTSDRSGEVEVRDTTGAGEVVAGVYIANKLLDKSDSIALDTATTIATVSVGNFGTDHLRS